MAKIKDNWQLQCFDGGDIDEMATATSERLAPGVDCKVLERRSVILYGPMEGRSYFREDFSKGLVEVLGGPIKEHVLSFGPLSRNNEWYLCLRSDAAKDRLLSAGQCAVKGFVFKIRSADRSQFKVRVHWATPFLPNDTITDFLGKYGKVHAISFEKSVSKGYEGVATGVRTVIMSGNKNEIPHIITLVDGNERSELLVTVTGRQPLCLRCRLVGHFRRECSTPFCRHHGEYGHTTEQCSAAGSYASALRERTTGNLAESELMNIEEEMDGDMEGEGETLKGGGEVCGKVVEVGDKVLNKGEKGVQQVEEGKTVVVEKKVEVEKDNGEVGEVTTVASSCPESEKGDPLLGLSEDIFSEVSSEDVSSDDRDQPWTEVRRKRKRETAPRERSVSPPPPSVPPLLGRLVIVEEGSDSSESIISVKKKCSDERGEED